MFWLRNSALLDLNMLFTPSECLVADASGSCLLPVGVENHRRSLGTLELYLTLNASSKLMQHSIVKTKITFSITTLAEVATIAC